MNRLTRTVAALICAGMITAVPAVPAVATVVTGNVDGLPIGAIDTSRTAGLTIHKIGENPYNEVPAGEKPRGGVAGATFIIDHLGGYDISDEVTWEIFRDLDVEDTESAPVLETFVAVTDSDGNAEFDGLTPGLYRVREKAPADASRRYLVSAPFLVTLPVGEVDGRVWSYDVVIPRSRFPRRRMFRDRPTV